MGLCPTPQPASANQLVLLMNLDFNKNNDDSNYGNKIKAKAGNIYQSHIPCTRHYSKSVSSINLYPHNNLSFLKIIILLFFGHIVRCVGSQFTNRGSSPRPLL